VSYSRWSNSCWYTYWQAGTDGVDDSALLVHHVAGEHGNLFTAKQLRDDIGKCLADAKADAPDSTACDLEELRGYMNEFVSDVRRRFK